MININKLEDLRKHALIVKSGVVGSIIDSAMYAEPTKAQALALVSVCDKVVGIIDDYLVYPEEYNEEDILAELLSMKYLLHSIRTDEIGYCDVVLECCCYAVSENFWCMVNWFTKEF